MARRVDVAWVAEPRRRAEQLFWFSCVALVFGNLPCAGAEPSVCPLPWNSAPSAPDGINATAVCPHGYRIPRFDVTVPRGTTPFSVNGFCVFWGVVPFAVVGFSVVDFIIRTITLGGLGTREVSFLVFVGLTVGLNELVFKKIAMEARPDHSCNTSCGFPSGHATMACGFFTLMFMDAVYRTMPRLPLNIHDARSYIEALKGQQPIFFGWSFRELCVVDCRALITLMPLSAAHTLNQTDFAVYSVVWGLLLLPVPFSRVVLYDHTPKQVMVGSAIGIVEALLFFALVRGVQHQYNHLLGRRLGCVFIHDFPLPMYEVQSKCYRLLATLEDNPSTPTARFAEGLLQDMHRELGWYRDQLKREQCLFTQPEEDHLSACRETGKLERMRDEIRQHLGLSLQSSDGDDSESEGGFFK